jgi:hypothetical protein
MKNFFTFNKPKFIKILVIFFIGFVFRIIINQYMGINVFLDYTNYISILYYFNMSFILVNLDQLFYFHQGIHVDIDSVNKIRPFNNNNSKTTNIFFNKDNSIIHKIRCKLTWYSLGEEKSAYGSYDEYKLTWDPKASVWKEVKNLFKWSFHWIDNKPTGILDPINIEARTEHERKEYLYKQTQHKELIQQENKRKARYLARFGKRKS